MTEKELTNIELLQRMLKTCDEIKKILEDSAISRATSHALTLEKLGQIKLAILKR